MSALPDPPRRGLPRLGLLAGILVLVAVAGGGAASLLGAFERTKEHVEEQQLAQEVDASCCMSVPADTKALIARHTPILALGKDDYDPVDALIYFNETGRGGITEACTTELVPRPSSLSVGECVNASLLGALANVRSLRLDVAGLDVLDVAGFKELYDRLAPDHDRVTYANVQTQGGLVLINYWLFYFFNFNPGGIGNHEGDWERVQVRIIADGVGEALDLDPERDAERFSLAISRHRCDSTGTMPARPWGFITSQGTHPVVYPGIGSHANYFEPGFKRPGHDGVQCTVFDVATDDRRLELQPVLIDCAVPSPAWLGFAGSWGSNGPDGPCQHEARDGRLPLR